MNPTAGDDADNEKESMHSSFLSSERFGWLMFWKQSSEASEAQLDGLHEEELEILRMATGLATQEIKRLRNQFTQCVSNPNWMTRQEFLEIPVIKINPLHQRLAVIFELKEDEDKISFREFITTLSIFNNPDSKMEEKLKVAFRIQDFDDDGKISKGDLRAYLMLTCNSPDSSTSLDIDEIVDRIMLESSSNVDNRFLSMDDFNKIIAPTDFHTKLRIAF